MIWKLTKLSYLGGGGITSHLNITTKKDNAISKVGVGFILCFMALYLAFMFFSASMKMFATGLIWDYASFFLTLLIIEFFFMFSSSDNVFFKSDDLAMLSTLPVTKRQLFISRVNMMLIEGYYLSLLGLVGLAVSTVLFTRFSLLWVVAAILMYLTMPLFLTTISAYLSLFLSEKPKARVIKRGIYYIILIAFFFLYITLYTEGLEMLESSSLVSVGVVDKRISLTFVIASLFFILFFALSLPVLERKFLSIKEEEVQRKVRKDERVAARGVVSSLMTVDWNTIKGESSFAFELFGEVLMPVILIVLYSVMGILDDFGVLLDMAMSSRFTHLIIVTLVLSLSAINGLSSTSFSREGKDHYLLESLPISRRERYEAKLFLHLLMFVPFDAAILILVGIFLKMPLWFYPISILMLLCFTTLSSMIGLIIDGNAPYLEWARPQMAVKNNMNMIKSMLATLVLGALMLVPGYLLSRSFGVSVISLVVPMAIGLLLSGLSLIKLR